MVARLTLERVRKSGFESLSARDMYIDSRWEQLCRLSKINDVDKISVGRILHFIRVWDPAILSSAMERWGNKNIFSLVRWPFDKPSPSAGDEGPCWALRISIATQPQRREVGYIPFLWPWVGCPTLGEALEIIHKEKMIYG